jgi:hypothetical protein
LAVEDFLITFRADTTGALASIQRLAAAVQQAAATPIGAQGAQGLNAAARAAGGLANNLQSAVTQSRFLGKSVAELIKLEAQAANRLSNIRTQTGGQIGAGGIVERKTLTDLMEINTLLDKMGHAGAAGRVTALAAQLRQLGPAANTATSALSKLVSKQQQLEQTLANFRLRSGTSIGGGGAREREIVSSLVRNVQAMQALGDTSRATATKLKTFTDQYAAIPGTVDRATAALQRSQAAQQNAVSALRARATLTSEAGLGQLGRGELQRGFITSIGLVRQGVRGAADDARFFADEINKLPKAWDESTAAFSRHARRIAEGIIIYDAFGRAVQGIADTIKNIADVTREQIRFEAVIQGNVDQAGFIAGLGDVAVRTNTQMADLASVLDTVGASLSASAEGADTYAQSMEFLNDVGQFTNITQRDVATETDNLIGLFNLSGDSVEEFGDRLGRIVVAGKNSSASIGGITDALNEAGRSAADAGFDFDVLTAIAAQVIPKFRGAISGRELGGAINTFIGRLNDPEVVRSIEEISQGFIQVRDAAGELRPASDVFIDIARAMDQGVLPAETLQKVIDQIVPPLNPAARATINTLLKELPEGLKNAGAQYAATSKNAKELSDQLVSGPAETVSRALIALGVAAQEAFADDVVQGAKTLAAAVGALSGAIEFAGTGFGGFLLQFGAFAAGTKLAIFGLKSLATLFFGAQIRALSLSAAIAGITRTSLILNTVSGNFGKMQAGMTGAALAARGLAVALKGVLISLAPMLALMALFEAINFAAAVDEQSRALQTNSAALVTNAASLDLVIQKLKEQRAAGGGDPIADIAKGVFVDPALLASEQNLIGVQRNMDLVGQSADDLRARAKALNDEVNAFHLFGVGGPENMKQTRIELDVLNAAIERIGDSNRTVTFEDLIGGLQKTDEDAGETSDELNRFEEILDALNAPLDAAAAGVDDLATAEGRLTAATQLNNALGPVRAAILNEYLDQLERGAITLDEFNAKQANIGQASDVASRFLVNFGNQLNLIPGLQERIARTGEDAATALTRILTSGEGETVDDRIAVVESMIAIAEANAETAEAVASNPITPRVNNEVLKAGITDAVGTFAALREGTADTVNYLNINRPTPQLNLSVLRAQLQEALASLQALKSALAGTNPAFNLIPGFIGDLFKPGLTQEQRDLQRKIDGLRAAIKSLQGSTESGSSRELEALRRQLDVLNGIKEGDARLGSSIKDAVEKPQTALIDVEELSKRQVERAIRLARALQSSIPGASKDARDETVALVKDARFLQFIKGLDQRFLAEAIQELTEIERRRLELEQQRLQDVTRSLVTQVGPIQSLVSSPILASGGGMFSGQGLNADPRLGNVTINVPINWSGMSLRELQNFIYKSISQAWIDSGRGG